MARRPVSDELRELILASLNKKKEGYKSKDGGTISGAAKGTEPGQIIMCAPEGEVLVEASEDESFIYLDFPSGVRKKAPKGQFLRKLDDETNHGAPTGE
jgi:hypothetical protein